MKCTRHRCQEAVRTFDTAALMPANALVTTISIVSDEGDVTISGSLHTYAEPVNYLPNESIEIEGCNVSLLDGALASSAPRGTPSPRPA